MLSSAQLKKWFLLGSKYAGLFWLGRIYSRNRLNILCYHGFSYTDEHEFSPSLFMTGATLNKRLCWLRDHGFEVISLAGGVEKLVQGEATLKTVVITIDDGFRSTLEIAAPIFSKYGFPATLYVTSYYASKELPIFSLVVQYLAWKAGNDATSAALNEILELPNDTELMDAVNVGQKLTATERVEVSRTLATNIDVDYDTVADSGQMSLLNAEEIEEIQTHGIDVQLHTHRHRFPLDEFEIERELTQNREFLGPLVKNELEHFCYPSGIWDKRHFPALKKLSVKSATTCEPGMNKPCTHPYALSRFLDREDFEQIEFEAELCGYKEMMRATRNLFRRNVT